MQDFTNHLRELKSLLLPRVCDKIRLSLLVHTDDLLLGAGHISLAPLLSIPRQETFLFSTGLALTTSHLTGKSITRVAYAPQASSRTYHGLSDMTGILESLPNSGMHCGMQSSSLYRTYFSRPCLKR